MLGKLIAHIQKKRQAKRQQEYASRFKRNRKIGRHHPAHVLDSVGDFLEDAIKWD